MKKYTRFLTPACAITALAALVGGSLPARAAGQSHPFRAVLTGQTSVKPCGAGVLCLTATDAGTTPLLGATRLVTHSRVQLTQLACATFQGHGAATMATETGTFNSSIGGTLVVASAVAACHGAAGTIAVGGFMFVGGTGRFAGATGSGRIRIVDGPTGAETMRLTGTITTPGM